MEIPYIVNARKDTGLNNSKIAIWLFLASEVMLFGGLFSSYIFLRIFADYPWPERALPVLPGLINTFILIASSVTVVYAWAALKLRKWPVFVVNMAFTLICAAVFMFFKAKEYAAKFDHQSIQYNDWSIIEGHTYPEKDGGGNFYAVEADQVNFKLDSYHKPYLKTILERIGDAEMKFATDYKMTKVSDDGTSFTEEYLVKKGDVVNSESLYKILTQAKEYHIEARTHNQNVRTEALRKAWKQARNNEGGKFSSLKGKSHFEPEYKEAVNTLHSELIENKATGMLMNDQDSLAIELNGTLIKITPSWGQMNVKTVGKATSVDLKDSTSIKGKAADSGMKIAIDAIDFRHMVMKLEEKIADGTKDEKAIEKAIAASPVLNLKGEKGDEIRKLWDTHQQWLTLFSEHLEKKGLVPTHVDKYRVTWKQMVAYTKINDRDDLKLTLETAKAEQPTMLEGFAGADHYNEQFKKAFVMITVPRDEIRFESVFSPRMNNYYAIYFTVTGLHGLHVIGGALVLGYFLFFGYGMYKQNPDWLANRVEVAGLFWHFVDLVWIFAFPIFYLM